MNSNSGKNDPIDQLDSLDAELAELGNGDSKCKGDCKLREELVVQLGQQNDTKAIRWYAQTLVLMMVIAVVACLVAAVANMRLASKFTVTPADVKEEVRLLEERSFSVTPADVLQELKELRSEVKELKGNLDDESETESSDGSS